jgi:hypothetical protein
MSVSAAEKHAPNTICVDTARALMDLYKEKFGEAWVDSFNRTVTISVPSVSSFPPSDS